MSTGVVSVVSSHASALVCFGERTRCVGLFAETVSLADEEQTLPPLAACPAQEVSFRSTFSPDLTRPSQPPWRRQGPTSWSGNHSLGAGCLQEPPTVTRCCPDLHCPWLATCWRPAGRVRFLRQPATAVPGVLLGKVGAGAAHSALRSRGARYVLQLRDHVPPLQPVAAGVRPTTALRRVTLRWKSRLPGIGLTPPSQRDSFPQGWEQRLLRGTP